MTSGMYIVAVCAVGALIACAGFWWAARSGQFKEAAEARWLVFDEGEELERAREKDAQRTGSIILPYRPTALPPS